jgi:hypothetical protein
MGTLIMDRATTTAAVIELRSKSRSFGRAFVHHLRQLQAGADSVQRDLHRHLANLQGADADIEGLLGLVSRVIFDRPIEIVDKSRRGARRSDRGSAEVPVFSTFSVDLDELARKELRNESVALGDLGEILDVLIRVLGQGIVTLPETEAAPPKNEEELIDTEDETLIASSAIDPFKMVEACSRKVGTLYSRMRKRLEASVDDPDEALRSLCQLAAVLGTVYVLRTSADRASWMPGGCSLVPREKSRQFVHEVTNLLYGNKSLIALVTNAMRNDIAEVSQVQNS